MSTEAPPMKWLCNYNSQHPLGKACDCAPPTGPAELHEHVCDRCGKLTSIRVNPVAGAAAPPPAVAFIEPPPPVLANNAAAAIPLYPTYRWPDDFCQCPPDESQDWKGLYLTGLAERQRLEHELRQVHANLSSALVREKTAVLRVSKIGRELDTLIHIERCGFYRYETCDCGLERVRLLAAEPKEAA